MSARTKRLSSCKGKFKNARGDPFSSLRVCYLPQLGFCMRSKRRKRQIFVLYIPVV